MQKESKNNMGFGILQRKLLDERNRSLDLAEPESPDRLQDNLIHSYLLNPEQSLAEFIKDIEKNVLIRVLFMTGGNQKQAANLLGIKENTLSYKVKTLGLKTDQSWINRLAVGD